MGDRDAGVGGGGDAGGDPRHHLELDPGLAQRFALLAAAAEDERVAALQPHHALAGARRLDQPLADLLLRHRGHARLPCRHRPARRPRAPRRAPRRDQPVVVDRVGRGDQLQRSRRHQARIARAGADEVDDPGAGAHAISSATGRRGCSSAHAARRAGRWRQRRQRSRACRSARSSRPRRCRGPTRCRRAGRRRRPVASGRLGVDPGVDADRAGAARRRAGRRRRARRSARAAPLRRRSASTARRASSSSSRICSSQRPLAGRRGHQSSGIGKAISRPRPSRRSPAAARTIASSSPSASLRSRVSTLPCSSLTSRSGRAASSCACRRRLAVPTRAPFGYLVERRPGADPGVGRGPRAAAPRRSPAPRPARPAGPWPSGRRSRLRRRAAPARPRARSATCRLARRRRTTSTSSAPPSISATDRLGSGPACCRGSRSAALNWICGGAAR